MRWLLPLLALLTVPGAARAQFEPPTVERGPKLAEVAAYPPAGDYTNTTGVTLRGPAGAVIHYTMDGSKPTEDSPAFDPSHLIFLAGLYDGNKGLTTGYTIRAVAVQPSHTDSDPATFSYTIKRRDRTEYISEEVAPGVRMIRDSDNDKMYLVRGARAYALIDTGMGRGDLKRYISQFTGGLPLVLILTHSHGDHIAQANAFIEGSDVYAGAPDRPAVAEFLKRQGITEATLAAHLKPLDDGATVDLGDRRLEVALVPGHTPGSLAILDPLAGNLFTGDTFGNNSPLPPDVMWMQWSREPLDRYLASELQARQRFAGRIKRIFTGHNDRALIGTAYLDNLEKAIQRGLDRGIAALIPSWRPPGLSQLVEGDRFSDPNWFGVNVNADTFLPAPPDEIAGLTEIRLTGAALQPAFSPEMRRYRLKAENVGPASLVVRPTASRSRITLNGKPLEPGVMQLLDRKVDATLRIVSADGRHEAEYRLSWADARR